MARNRSKIAVSTSAISIVLGFFSSKLPTLESCLMLVKNKRFASPEVERLIRDILDDDARFESELRSVHRERLVCPVEIIFGEDNEVIHAFSRNLSSEGVALITDRPFEERTISTLSIYRTAKPGGRVVAECKWCKPFGERYWISGWQFTHVPRN